MEKNFLPSIELRGMALSTEEALNKYNLTDKAGQIKEELLREYVEIMIKSDSNQNNSWNSILTPFRNCNEKDFKDNGLNTTSPDDYKNRLCPEIKKGFKHFNVKNSY